MKHSLIVLTNLSLILFFIANGCEKNQTAYEENPDLVYQELSPNYTVMIDAGIRFDTASMEQKSKEIAISSIAEKLKNHLEKESYKVVLIRTQAKSLPMKKRAKLAEELSANVIISLTDNIVQDEHLKSFHTLFEKIYQARQKKLGNQKRVSKLKELFFNEMANSGPNKALDDLGSIFYIISPPGIINMIIDMEQTNFAKEKKNLISNNYQEKISRALSKCITSYIQLVEKSTAARTQEAEKSFKKQN
jgi:N-acetylmuramoyl-L-alanine amidase